MNGSPQLVVQLEVNGIQYEGVLVATNNNNKAHPTGANNVPATPVSEPHPIVSATTPPTPTASASAAASATATASAAAIAAAAAANAIAASAAMAAAAATDLHIPSPSRTAQPSHNEPICMDTMSLQRPMSADHIQHTTPSSPPPSSDASDSEMPTPQRLHNSSGVGGVVNTMLGTPGIEDLTNRVARPLLLS